MLFSCKMNQDEPCFYTEEYRPVCTGGNQYSNKCKAKCEGFNENEISEILTQEKLDTGVQVKVNCPL